MCVCLCGLQLFVLAACFKPFSVGVCMCTCICVCVCVCVCVNSHSLTPHTPMALEFRVLVCAR